MKTTLTKLGQMVVPAEIRRRYNMQRGAKLTWLDDGETIRAVVVHPDIVKALRGTGKGYQLTRRLLAERITDCNGNPS